VASQCFKPISTLIGELNLHLNEWVNYFSSRYSTDAHWEIEWYVVAAGSACHALAFAARRTAFGLAERENGNRRAHAQAALRMHGFHGLFQTVAAHHHGDG